MNVLLLSLGGGGGNILRSLKALFRRDLLVSQKIDSKYAERLRRAVTTRFLDTNEFSLADVPREERLLIGARTTGRLGARHNPDIARQALEESRSDVEALLRRHSVVIVIGTGGKGTGAGTMVPIAQMARELRKLVIPIFVRPSFERHEVDKRRYDHALKVLEQLDGAKIRLIEILNDRGYMDQDPQPQSVVWERMNLPIARGLRGLIYVLSDLSQVDPSDLSILFAGDGRIRIGFSEIDPETAREPTDRQIEEAAEVCWQSSYYAFRKSVGTSLICIQGDWSNVVDAKLKGRLASIASASAPDSPYTPLYARAVGAPKPWGVTAVFAEHTGSHAPLEIDWTLGTTPTPLISVQARTRDVVRTRIRDVDAGSMAVISVPKPIIERTAAPQTGGALKFEPPCQEEVKRSFSNLWEFAVAVNRADPTALALARDGVECGIVIDGHEVKKLLGTMWFRAVVPRLSQMWRDRILQALVESVAIPNHVLKVDRRAIRLSELRFPQLDDLIKKRYVPDAARPDLELLVMVGRLWGAEAMARFRFVDAPRNGDRSRFASLLQGFHR